jgi:hypothetical protein
MKKLLMQVALVGLAFSSGVALAEKVQDWKDIDKVHKHIVEAIKELDRAREANHYDMAGHAKKAEELLHQAEKELHESVEAAKSAH